MNTAQPVPLTERAWQETVVAAAKALGWLSYHTYDSRQSERGFPDLVLVRERVIFAELKTERGALTREQGVWRDRLLRAGAEWYLWRPSSWSEVQRELRRQGPIPDFGPDDFEVSDSRNPTDGSRGWWSAKCTHCGRWITKFDFTAEDARQAALRLGCRCRG